MKQEVKQTQAGGIGFIGLLTILFVGLKLTGFINWSWWWVLSPLWIAWGVFLVILVVILLFVILLSWLDTGK